MDEPSRDRTATLTERAQVMVAGAIAMFGVCLYLYGAVLLFLQSVRWLQTGYWIPLPALALFVEYPFGAGSDEEPWTAIPEALAAFHGLRAMVPLFTIDGFEAWVQSPAAWFGLHSAVTWTLSFLSVPAVGMHDEGARQIADVSGGGIEMPSAKSRCSIGRTFAISSARELLTTPDEHRSAA